MSEKDPPFTDPGAWRNTIYRAKQLLESGQSHTELFGEFAELPLQQLVLFHKLLQPLDLAIAQLAQNRHQLRPLFAKREQKQQLFGA